MCVDCWKVNFDKTQSKPVCGRTDLASGLWTSMTRPGIVIIAKYIAVSWKFGGQTFKKGSDAEIRGFRNVARRFLIDASNLSFEQSSSVPCIEVAFGPPGTGKVGCSDRRVPELRKNRTGIRF